MNNSKGIWSKIEPLQEELLKAFPGNMNPVNLELKLSPENLYQLLENAKSREVIVEYPDKNSTRMEVFYKNPDGTLEKVI